ncbi:MAG: primosomal protein N' [Oscillospiraceae bacterium]|nr:primosomal protein N' [Oscillospiraceae bacterium]
MIAKIAVSAANFAIDKPYSYRIPEGMDLAAGCRVVVSFGRGNRKAEGVVLSVEPETGDTPETLKTVERALDEEPLLTQHMLRLAAFMRERCFCTFYDAVRVMLPGGLWFRTKDTYRLTESRSWEEKEIRQADAKKLLTLLAECGGEATGQVVRQWFPDDEKRQAAIAFLVKKKWLVDETDFARNLSDKTEKIATLAASPEETLDFAKQRLRAPMQRSVLELMCAVGSAAVKEICYYTGAKPATVKRLAELGYLELSDRPVLRCSEIKPAKLDGELILNQEQQEAYLGLSRQMDEEKPGSALLYGVTGSGKTAVYLKLIAHALEQDKAAMLLVPEIALTPQLLSLLAAHFGDRVAVLHSSLSAGERYDQWKRVRSGDARVIVGTRSAVFAPSSQLGLIIIDEEQEHTYKSENSPRYCAKEVALWRGLKENALVLLGSATPSVETMYRAKSGTYRLYTLRQRYNGKDLPQVRIVDMKEEIKQGNDFSISTALAEAIQENMAQKKQTILFLNRRGNSRALVCVECSETPECPRCSQRLTFHSANNRLMCHHCGYSRIAPKRCDVCGGPLKAVGTGTQKVQQELENLLPGVEIARMDSDTVSAVNTHEKILEHFQKDKVPVLIGTQMVAKGLNLPNVTLVGVLDADMSLYSGSYRGGENTFNMLTQVVGRAGRGDTPGQAVIQTMVPQHKVITLAAQQDYDSFYEMELALRKAQEYPPFGDLASVTFIGQDEGQVIRGAAKFRDSLSDCMKLEAYRKERCTVLGPAPCAVPKINYHFRYRLTLRCHMTKPLRQLLAHLLQQFSKDGANRGVSAFIDINGFED